MVGGIGILPGKRLSYIDHLVPLCQILHIPVLVTERAVKEIIEIYYPKIEILLAEPDDYCLDPWLVPYEYFVYVDPFRLANGHFYFVDYYTHLKRPSVYSMHGNSDKKARAFWIEQLADEDVILLYGYQAADFLKGKGVERDIILCGNYRKEYYLENKSFFDQKCQIHSNKTTILYAPTWTSKNRKSDWRFDYSPFFETHRYVLEKIPDHYQLIVKMHPLYQHLMQEELEKVKEQYPHICFLDDCPLIYPLLFQTDIYLGDFSSIGYDFLALQKPMFFLPGDESAYLHQCGKSLSKIELPDLWAHIDANKDKDAYKEIQQRVYEYAFGPRKNLKQLEVEIKRACKSTF